jgi:hypothetical protein
MNKTPFTSPEFQLSAFNCPFCNAYANQNWGMALIQFNGREFTPVRNCSFSICSHCHESAHWVGDSMVFPGESNAPLPNPDMPDDIQNDFNEAREIINKSPRGASALFRLCIQKLCKHLGESGENINADIAQMVKKGLNINVQKSLDAVRVIGNESVHPGKMDIKDNADTAIQLARLVNFVVDAMISQPNEIQSVYNSLPKVKIDQIIKRDAT